MNRFLRSKAIACTMILVLVGELIAPASVSALTSGPASPEFTSFEPIGTTGMVNEFTGTFTYNLPLLEVPGPHGSGYPISLAYHSGAALEEDATWVGFGWTLNPGAINRNVRGFPDDYNGSNVTYLNRQPSNETFVIGSTSTLQTVSKDHFSYEVANRWNTYTGYSVSSGFSLYLANMGTLRFSSQNGVKKPTFTVDWPSLFQQGQASPEAKKLVSDIDQQNESVQTTSESTEASHSGESIDPGVYQYVQDYITNGFFSAATPSTGANYSGAMFTVKFGYTGSLDPLPVLIGAHVGLSGTYSWQSSEASRDRDSYGYIYQGNADPDADFTDYGTEREAPYTTRDRYLHGVYNSYDMFNCTAQGVTGAMRLQHRKVGHSGPVSTSTDMPHFALGLEFGAGPGKLSTGSDVSIGYSQKSQRMAASDLDSIYGFDPVASWNNGRVVMRFVGDKSDQVSYSTTDGPQSISTNLIGLGSPEGIYQRVNNWQEADSLKRLRQSSSVSYRTNKEIAEYTSQVDGVRYYGYSSKGADHEKYLDRSDAAISDGIGEIAVRNPSGSMYVFGLPVYSRNERQLTYIGTSADTAVHTARGIVYGKRPALSSANVSGFIKRDPYAAAYLLTEVRTPDYIDRSLDGPTPDDYGGYTQFTYRQAAGTYSKTVDSRDSTKAWFRWRIPYQGFAYDAGRPSLAYDNKASVSMGEREVYYLKSIDTKTHTAFFVTNQTDTTITLNGQPYRLKGSGRQRYDAFEAYNTGNLESDEDLTSEGAGYNRSINTALDVDSASRYLGMGMSIGGRTKDTKTNADDEWISTHTAKTNKSEYLERIVLLAKTPSGSEYSEVIKTVNLEYDYQIMSERSSGPWVQTKRWHPVLGKPVPLTNPMDWDTIYSATGPLNSAVILTQQGLWGDHASKNRLNCKRHGKLTLKRVWTDYGKVKSARISPYEFQYSYRNPRSQSYPSEISSDPHLQDIVAFDATYTNASLAADSLVDSASQVHQNPAYSPALADPWGAYRIDGAYANERLQDHLNQGITATYPQFDPAAWQLKIIRLPSGGRIHVQYERNTYSYVQDRRAMAMLPLQSVVPGPGGNTYYVDHTSLVGRDPAVIKRLLQECLDKNERLYFKFLYPVQLCSPDLSSDYKPTSTSEYITGYTKAVITETAPVGTIGIQFTSTPTPKDILAEYVANQDNRIVVCSSDGTITGQEPEFDRNSLESWQRLLDMSAPITSNAVKRRTVVTSQPSPYLQRSYIRIPCSWKYGGGVRVKRIFLYDPGIEYGRAALYGSEYEYTTQEGGIAISSGVATNEPAAIREENALVQYTVGRAPQSAFEYLASGEDLDQFEGPFCMSAFPSPSIGYSRVAVRNIVSTGSTPGFTVTEFNTARDYPVIERSTHLETNGIGGLPPIPLGYVSVVKGNYIASQGFSVQLNSMHGTVKRISKCRGPYTSNEDAWQVVESVEHEYFKPGEAIPVLTRDGSAIKIVSKRMGVDMDVAMETRRVAESDVTGTLPFDVGISLPFAIWGHVAPPTLGIVNKEFLFAVVCKTVSYSTFEKKTTVTRDGMKYSIENIAFDEATGEPAVTMFVDDQQGNIDNSGAISGGAVTYSIPAWLHYPVLGPTSNNEGIQDSGSVTSDANGWIFAPTVGANASVFVPGDLVDLHLGDTHRFGYVDTVNASSIHLVPAYGNSDAPSGAVYSTIVRSGYRNQITASAGTVVRHAVTGTQTGTISWNTMKVLKASATTYSDNWDPSDLITQPSYTAYQTNLFEKGIRGRWRPDASYVYRDLTSSVFDGYTIGRTGHGATQFNLFPYDSPATRDTLHWVRTTTVADYNENGDALYELDALGIPSCALFGYQGSVPVVIARNAEHGSAAFLSFEDNATASTAAAHTGARSMLLGASVDSLLPVKIGDRLQASGLMVRAWIYGDASASAIATIGGTTLSTPSEIADVNGWKLIEWIVEPSSGPLATTGIKGVSFHRSGGSVLYMDDIRIQPLDAEATCYVYDQASLRLIAQFDDQHFAALYKYNEQGMLKRKDRETERGVYPLQEMHRNTPTIAYTTEIPTFGSINYLRMPWTAGGIVDRIRSAEFPDLPTSGLQSDVDVLDLNINPQRARLKLFDGPTKTINVDSLLRSSARTNLDTAQSQRGRRENR